MPSQEIFPGMKLPLSTICFGLDRETDERSLNLFLARFSRPELLARLTPRLEEAEILQLVDTLTSVMQRHFSEQEYHCLFLNDNS